MIKEIKQVLGDNKLVAVAGGITPDKVDEALSSGADIIVVGRNIFLRKLTHYNSSTHNNYMVQFLDLNHCHCKESDVVLN